MSTFRHLLRGLKFVFIVLATNALMACLVIILFAKGVIAPNYETLRLSSNVFLDLRVLSITVLMSPLVTAIASTRFNSIVSPVAIFLGLWPGAVAIALVLSPMTAKESLLNPFKIFYFVIDPLMDKTELATNFSLEKFSELSKDASEAQVLEKIGKPPFSIYHDRTWRYSRAKSDGDYWQIIVVIKEDGLDKRIMFYLD